MPCRQRSCPLTHNTLLVDRHRTHVDAESQLQVRDGLGQRPLQHLSSRRRVASAMIWRGGMNPNFVHHGRQWGDRVGAVWPCQWEFSRRRAASAPNFVHHGRQWSDRAGAVWPCKWELWHSDGDWWFAIGHMSTQRRNLTFGTDSFNDPSNF